MTAERDPGSSILEYVLIICLVALAGAAGLALLGLGTHGPMGAARAVTVQLRAGPAPGPPADWCASDAHGCVASVVVGTTSTIHFWATGGEPPYDYSLEGAPHFAHLSGLDHSGGTGEVVIAPAGCADAGHFGPVQLLVSPSSGPAASGSMRFSISVTGSPSC